MQFNLCRSGENSEIEGFSRKRTTTGRFSREGLYVMKDTTGARFIRRIVITGVTVMALKQAIVGRLTKRHNGR